MIPDSSRAARDLLARLVSRATLLGDAAELVRERHEEVSRVSARREHVIALVGDTHPRTALLNQLLGFPLLAEDRLDLTGTTVAFKHGARFDYRVRLEGGATEQYSRLAPPAAPHPAVAQLADIDARLPALREAVRAAEASIADELEALGARLAFAQGEVEHARANAATRREAVALAARELPRFHRERPPWWAIWLWIPRLLLRFWGHARATYAQATRQLAAGESKIAALDAEVASARQAVEERRARVAGPQRAALGTLEVERARVLGEIEAAELRERDRFAGALRELTDLGARGPDVEELLVEVPGPALPPGLVLLDVGLRGHAEDRERSLKRLVEDADGCLVTSIIAPEIVKRIDSFGIVALPPDQNLTAALAVLRHERVRRVTERTVEAVKAARIQLVAAEERAERSFRARLAAAEAMRIVDPGAMAAEQLARATGSITERAHLAIQHGSSQLAHALSLLEKRWRDAIARSITMDELRHTVARIDHEAPDALREVQHEVHLALGGVVGGALRDLAPGAVAALLPRFRALDLPLPAPDGLDTASLPALASLARPGLGASLEAGWLASIFRPFEVLREEAGARLADRVAKIRNACSAELLDAEPPITALLRGSLEALCLRTTATLAAAAERRIVEEQAAIAAEREALAPVAALRHELDDPLTQRDALALGSVRGPSGA